MVRGGHAASGPPPNPNALRRERDGQEWTHLPSDGRSGDAPAWPLSTSNGRERDLWAAEWRRPQALMWEARGQVLEVALYVRAVIVAEGRKATAADRTLVLRYMEDLGVSTGGLARNRWVIDDTGVQTEDRPAPAGRPSAKDRLKLVVND